MKYLVGTDLRVIVNDDNDDELVKNNFCDHTLTAVVVVLVSLIITTIS